MNLFAGVVTPERRVSTAVALEIAAPVPVRHCDRCGRASRCDRTRACRAKTGQVGFGGHGPTGVLPRGRAQFLDLTGENAAGRDDQRRHRTEIRASDAVWLSASFTELPGIARANLAQGWTYAKSSAGTGRNTSRSAMIGASPSRVVRCISRTYFASSNGVAQCCAQRLSHNSASPTRH